MRLANHPALSKHQEHQYLDLLRDLLDAPTRDTRNDEGTRSLFGRQMRFDMSRGFPLLTTKKLPFRVIAGELIWFLSGSTNVRPLHEQGIKIWNEWADENGDLGPVYGEQFRGQLGCRREPHDVTKDGRYNPLRTDQVAQMLRGLHHDPYGRRHVMTLWNAGQIDQMALPPCHGIAIQFYVETDGRLSLFMHQRSADAFLGLPFNIASYALLLTMFARALDREPGEFVWSGGDVHLYANHVEQARQQILREPRPLPWLSVANRNSLDDWTLGDFTVSDYRPWPHIAAEVSA